MADEIDKSKPGWWAEKQPNYKPKAKTKADKIFERLGRIEMNTEPESQLARDIHFIAKALKVWIVLVIAGLIIWIGYIVFLFG